MNVQVIDYSCPTAPWQFAKALRTTGFAVVTNHPISPSLLRSTYTSWSRFFHSDAAVKEALHYHNYLNQAPDQSGCQAGYFPFKSESAKGFKESDLKEFYHVYPWGPLPEDQKTTTLQTYESLESLASEFLNWIEESTPPEIRAQFSEPLSSMVQNNYSNLLRVVHYPPLTGHENTQALRSAPHTDINLITLLPFSDEPGLQNLGADGVWYDVPSDSGMIAVNIGDMLQLASGGYYPSTHHRVINPHHSRNVSRLSMPLFLHPRSDVQLSSQHTADSYLKERLTELGLAA